MSELDDRRLRTGMLWNLVPVALLGIVGIGLNFFIGGWWGPTALGVFNQVATAYFILAVLGGLGINYSVLRAIAERPDDPDRIAPIFVGAVVPTAVASAVVTTGFVLGRHAIADLLDSDAVAAGIVWAAPGLCLFTINKVLLAAVNGLGRMRAYAVYTSIRYLGLAAALVGASVLDARADQLPVVWSVAEGALFVVLIGEAFATIRLSRARGWQAWSVEHVRFGARSVGAAVLSDVNSRVDIWLLGASLSDAQVGIYSMASTMVEGASQLAIILQANVNPMIVADLVTGRTTEVERRVRRARRWFVPLMAGACALGVAVFPFAIPWVTQDPAFAAAALPFALLCAGLVAASPWLPFNQVLVMGGFPGWQTLYVLISVVANVVLNLVLISWLGLPGAALATGLAMVASALLVRQLARSIVGVAL